MLREIRRQGGHAMPFDKSRSDNFGSTAHFAAANPVSTVPRRRRWPWAALVVVALVIILVGVVMVRMARARENTPAATATLRLADGRSIGRADFYAVDRGTLVRATIRMPAGAPSTSGFHGFHIHANDDATNGNNCTADPKKPANTWFLSADGHYDQSNQPHGNHDGDLTSLFVMNDGRATVEFRTDKVSPSQLARRAIIVHAGPDNFGNVPVGSGPTQYTPNSQAARDATQKTGNAGDRIACGLIELH
jgi:Cu-Zn family superoxide dismutase